MAKRKRLALPTPLLDSVPVELETKSTAPFGAAATPRAPIAQVAGDVAVQSALSELAEEMAHARKGGRLVQSLSLDAVVADHLVRDRMVQDPAEMESLKASLIARGQQTPIEVVDLGGGGYGLISGGRRLAALRALHQETKEARFATILALIKPVESASDSYVAMVEENEIRANLSFYERSHLAVAAVGLKVYHSTDQAIDTLFANATSAKRSKIRSFVQLVNDLGGSLLFPAAIPEHLGLALVHALKGDPTLARRVKDRLRKSPSRDAADERRILESTLRKTSHAPKVQMHPVAADITLEVRSGKVVLSGAGVTDALRDELLHWFSQR